MKKYFYGSELILEKERYVFLNTIDRVENFVNKIIAIDSDVDLVSGRYILDAKSIMAIFSICLTEKLKLIIRSDDEDEIKLFNEITEEFK